MFCTDYKSSKFPDNSLELLKTCGNINDGAAKYATLFNLFMGSK